MMPRPRKLGERKKEMASWGKFEILENMHAPPMKAIPIARATFCALMLLLPAPAVTAADAPPKPLRALLILGGCCHDYARQKDILKAGIEERAQVRVDIVYNPETTTQTRFDIYEKPDWARGYDVVIHDECSADVKDLPYVRNILAAHQGGVPAVNLHCAMHCYRSGTDDWFRFLGLQSSRHDAQKPIAITFTNLAHPVIKGLTDWTTINEEHYNNVKIFDTATPLAWGRQNLGRVTNDFVVVWVNDYHGTRVFNTTLGHNNLTVGDDRYLNLVTRGLLWACGKLDDNHLKPGPKKSAELVPAKSSGPAETPASAIGGKSGGEVTGVAAASTPSTVSNCPECGD
jgi:type 1 glutamine amidotransferase